MLQNSLYDQVDRYLSANRILHLEQLKRFLSVPSISALSAHKKHTREASELLADKMKAIGLQKVQVMETGGHPVVYGEWLGAPGKPTALVYGHYDVQPVDPIDLWETPPFEPTERNGKLFGRGSSDDKGQVWIHLLAVEALLKTAGELPVNLKFLIEGEEEISSRHLPQFVADHAHMLSADLVVISDSPMYARGMPTICYGLRGLATMEVHVYGPRTDLHSGLFGGAIANPLHAMAKLIAGLHDADGRVTVPGFYDDVQPIQPEESLAFAKIPFDETEYCESIGVPKLFGEEGFSTLERTWARPTLEVNGLWGGFQGEGAKTIVPSEAHAKITCRLVPDQEPERILNAISAHLHRVCPKGVRLEVAIQDGAPAVVTPIDSSYVRSAAKALHRVFGREVCYIRCGGSIGIAPTLIQEIKAPLILIGFGLPDENFHAPNEHFDLGNYELGKRAVAAYWLELGMNC